MTNHSRNERPPDVLWQSPDALTSEEVELLRTCVREKRGRDLCDWTLFEDGDPETLQSHPEFDRAERLYVAGGDGTVSLAMNASQLSKEVGLLPRGTGNDFARAAGLPVDEEWPALVEVATGTTARAFDLGWCNGRRFANAVTVGFGAEATRDLDGPVKRWTGSLGYALFTFWKAFAADPFEIRVRTGDGEEWRGEVLALILVNGRTVGGGLEVGRSSSLDDGKLDLAWLPKPEGDGTLRSILNDWNESDPEDFEHLRYLQAERFTVDFSRDVAASVDGESTELSHLDAHSEPGAVSLVVPSRA